MWLLVLSLSLLLLLLLNYFIVIDNRFGYLLGLLSFRWRWQFGNSDTFFASFTLRLGGVFFLFVFSYFLFFFLVFLSFAFLLALFSFVFLVQLQLFEVTLPSNKYRLCSSSSCSFMLLLLSFSLLLQFRLLVFSVKFLVSAKFQFKF